MRVQVVKGSAEKRKLVIMIAAFAAVYIFWGSTYLAIRYAIETIPPFMMAATRFLTAGSILYFIARLQPDYEKPRAAHWGTSLIVGALLLLGGNGGVVFAEKYISSSLAALLVAVEPFWVVLLSWLWLNTGRPTMKVVFGLLIGFVGVWLLISGHGASADAHAASMQFWSPLVLLGSTFCWAAGSLFGLKAAAPRSALLYAGMQMLSGGTVLLLVSIVFGEWTGFHVSSVSTNSILGVAYLIVFGSLIGFTAYSWLLKNAKPANVATYAYVNPMIAVLLGWLIAGESFTGQMLIGAGVIVGSVVLITSQEKHGGSEGEAKCHDSVSPGGSGKTLSASA